jgi:cytochrome c-type biogenesis protein CcmF
MTDLGFICLSLALAATTYSIFALGMGAWRRHDQLISSGKKGVHAATVLLCLAVLSLVYAFLARDFSVEYVAGHSSRDLPLVYTVAALFAGQEGSLLFWSWLLSLFASTVLLANGRIDGLLLAITSLVIAVIQAFFLILLVFISNPFRRLDFVPPDGLGMNPLLQNPSMLWHPPILYLGYVGFTVPFALLVAGLVTGRLEGGYLRRLRRWSLLPWLCLGLGTLLGAQWAYVELGWGGYWAWDPVENASLMPWLSSTALIHSLMVQERRQVMKAWSVALVILTFALCIFGTFVTRSGVLSSIHGFGASGIGLPFALFLALLVGGSAVLVAARWPQLGADREWGRSISRQSALLLCVVLLLATTGAVLLGTVSPLLSGATQTSLTADYFNWTSVAILGPLILLMGICPFTTWRGSTTRGLIRDLLIPLICAALVGALLLLVGLRSPFAVLAFSICGFVLAGTLLQFYLGVRARRRTSGQNHLFAFFSMVRRQRRRYGAYIVHLGIVLVTIGVIGSSAYRVEEQVTARPGESVAVGAYSLRYDDFSLYPAPGKDVARATLSVFEGGKQVGTLVPERHFHRRAQQPVSEVAIRTTLEDDLYVALIGWEGDDPIIALEVVVSPLIVWMWIGGVVLLLGSIMVLWPDAERAGLEQRVEDEILRLRQTVGPGAREETR